MEEGELHRVARRGVNEGAGDARRETEGEVERRRGKRGMDAPGAGHRAGGGASLFAEQVLVAEEEKEVAKKNKQ